MSAEALSGRLGFSEVGGQLSRVDSLCETGIVDLSAITHVDSCGLSFLLELTRQAQRRGKTLQLIGAPAQLHELARFFKLDPLLKLGN